MGMPHEDLIIEDVRDRRRRLAAAYRLARTRPAESRWYRLAIVLLLVAFAVVVMLAAP
jgi:hypothetical protein